MSTSTLYFVNYNNYYNRQVKTNSSLADFKSWAILKIENVHFNPNDGVETSYVAYNMPEQRNPDYMVESQMVGGVETLMSRWFVLDAERIRLGEYKCSLRRDILCEFDGYIRKSPAFVEKGYVSNSNPLVFNKEGGNYNQIKVEQEKLKANTGSVNGPWIVGYIAQNGIEEPITI